MRRKVMGIGALSVLMALGTSAAVAQEGQPAPRVPAGDRFERIDLSGVGRVARLPQSVRPDVEVTVLVELSEPSAAEAEGDALEAGASEAAAAAAGAAALDRAAAQQAVAEPAIEASGAQVTGRFRRTVNAMRVRVSPADIARLAALPGVEQVQPTRLVKRANAVSSLYTGVPATWEDLGVTGEGVRVGIIDTGIDYYHATFGGSGDVADFEADDGLTIGTPAFPNAKVAGGWDFVGDDYDADSDIPANTVAQPDPDPLDCNGHGTHVAGTAAGFGVDGSGATYTGPYTADALQTTPFLVPPGSAPNAILYGYRVFGCEGSVTNDIVVEAIERAAADGVDVVNLSLGSTFGSPEDIDSIAVDNISKAGVLVVASSGNEGPGAYVTGSPGAADRALSVAAMDASSATFPGALIGTTPPVSGIVANGVAIPPAGITAEVMVIGLGCDPAEFAGAAGKIVITTRGVCARVDRAINGEAAGAVAVVMINNGPGLPPFEGPIPGVSIPFIGVEQSADATLSAADGTTLTIDPGPDLANPTFTGFADFTSNGPRRVDSANKPDITAPGVSVLSAGVGTGTDGVRISGTSMASPHTAGIAALVVEAHPTWRPIHLKAALMSTADPSKVIDYDSRRGGTGLVAARRAVDTVAFAWTYGGRNSLVFGFQEQRTAYHQSRSFNITNTSGAPITYDLGVEPSSDLYGAQLSVTPSTVTVPPGGTVQASLALALPAPAVAGLPGVGTFDSGDLLTINGVVTATPQGGGAGVYGLRLPYLFAPKGVSDVQAGNRSGYRGAPSARRATIPLRNVGIHAGDADVYAWGLRDRGGDAGPDVADILDVGVQTLPGEAGGLDPSDRLLAFGVNLGAGTSTLSTTEIDILVDAGGSPAADYVVVGVDAGLLLAGVPDGTFASFTIDLATGDLVDGWGAIAPANGSTAILPVSASALGLSAGSSRFSYSAAGFTVLYDAPGDDVPGVARFDSHDPAISQGDFLTLAPGERTRLRVVADRTELGWQNPKGWLIITLDDRAGARSGDRVPLGRP